MENKSIADPALKQKVIALAAAQVPIDISEVSLSSRFVEDLGYDSLDATEFVMELEDEFDITIPDEKAEAFKTVQLVVEWLESQLFGE